MTAAAVKLAVEAKTVVTATMVARRATAAGEAEQSRLLPSLWIELLDRLI